TGNLLILGRLQVEAPSQSIGYDVNPELETQETNEVATASDFYKDVPAVYLKPGSVPLHAVEVVITDSQLDDIKGKILAEEARHELLGDNYLPLPPDTSYTKFEHRKKTGLKGAALPARYLRGERIGHGAMGSVYKAYDVRLGR